MLVAVTSPKIKLSVLLVIPVTLPVTSPTKDEAVRTPTIKLLPLVILLAAPVTLPTKLPPVTTPATFIPGTVNVPSGAISWAFS